MKFGVVNKVKAALKSIDKCPYCKVRMDEIKAHAESGHPE